MTLTAYIHLKPTQLMIEPRVVSRLSLRKLLSFTGGVYVTYR